MAKIGTFKIESSFRLTGRGIVALGQIIDGIVRIGAYTNFEVGNKRVTMQISGVETADTNREKEEYAVALTFVYRDEMHRTEFEAIKLKEQPIDITYEPDLIDIINKVKDKITDDSDMVWTRYDNAKQFRDELDKTVQKFMAGHSSSLDELSIFFSPTGTLQEHAISNGWGDEYLAFAERFDSFYSSIMNRT